ncbi:phosphatidylserine decarboxylase family protein [Thermodesulfobacteriota bacterium]
MSDFVWSDPPSKVAFPVAKAGYPIIFAAAFATAVFALLGFAVLALAGLLATFFVCYFFRDPDRVIPNGDSAVVAPADGKVISVKTLNGSPFFEGTCEKISIFMSVFNVHVNRTPHEGRITKINYHPGKFFSANLDKASMHNEHNAVFMETETGKKMCMVQIAGLIARRIICQVGEGDRLYRGQRFGLICFGSRVDVYLPSGTDLKVMAGDKLKAGNSVIGYLR